MKNKPKNKIMLLLTVAITIAFSLTTASDIEAKKKQRKSKKEQAKEEVKKEAKNQARKAKKELEAEAKRAAEKKAKKFAGEALSDEEVAAAIEEIEKAKARVKELEQKVKKAKQYYDTAKALANSRLSPEKLLLGVFPNTDGFTDSKFAYSKNYLIYFSSGIDANYTTSNDNITLDNFESKTLKKEALVQLDVVNFTMPFDFGEDSLIGFKAGANCVYLFNNLDTAGYKEIQADTVYFNEDKNIHSITPSVDAGIKGAISTYLNFNITGGYLPFVLIKEKGEKNYSTYDNPIKYSLQNRDSGFQAQVSIDTLGLPTGDFGIWGKYIQFMGDYQTEQKLILGNYQTTIKTYSEYKKLIIDIGLNYKITFLKQYSDYVPILSVAYSKNQETLDGEILYDEDIYKFGVMVSLE